MLLEKDLPRLPNLKNGLILEFSSIRKTHATWNDLKEWIELLSGNSSPISRSAVEKSVTALETKKRRIQKSKSDNPREFLECIYRLPVTKAASQAERLPPHQSTFMKEAITTVNKSLAIENTELEAKIIMGTNLLLHKDREIMRLKEKLREYNPRNIRRQLKRKNSKIAKYTITIKDLKKDVKCNKQRNTKKLQDQVRYYAKKCELLASQLKEQNCTDSVIDSRIEQLTQEKIYLLDANAEYKDTIEHLKSRKLVFFEGGKFTDSIRMCIMELLSYNVGILNIEPILKSVLRMAGLEYDRLPKHTTINEMLIESRSLAQMQLAETLLQAPNTTLHSDGTTKFGHKYMGYQVSTTGGSLSLGLQVSQFTFH